MLPTIMILTFASVAMTASFLIPPLFEKTLSLSQKRTKRLTERMDDVSIRVKPKRVAMYFVMAPVIFAALGYLMFPVEFRLLGLLTGGVFGFLGPSIYIKTVTERRKSKFEEQLVDGLMMLSSSLKGGASIIQALEVLVEDMPDPISQEFSILLGENKMGISLEEAFGHLYERMPSVALRSMITAILLARETGGNLPVIFNRIVTTIRENRKIKQNIDNLTLQGKIQGTVMTLLPIGFAVVVTSANPRFFDQMFKTDIGRILMMYAFFSELAGAFFIWKISSFKEF